MNTKTMLITGTSKGIGKYLADYYLNKGFIVFGYSRGNKTVEHKNYVHFLGDVSDEKTINELFKSIRKNYNTLDVLINNAGIASMNHVLLTPQKTVVDIFQTNFIGTFNFCRAAAKLMLKNKFGRIINFSTVASPLNLEGEAAYASSKSAIEKFTKILAKELGTYNITVNCIGPTPIKTELIKSVPSNKIEALLSYQSIKRYGEFTDISNVIDFFLRKESDFITGQIIYLGGIS